MKFDLESCKWILWGNKNSYHTNGHVLSSFHKALKFLGRQTTWLDGQDNVSGYDFSNTLFIAVNDWVFDMPRRADCVYAIQNGGEQRVRDYFSGLALLSFSPIYYEHTIRPETHIPIGPHAYFCPPNGFEIRWGTDLLPHEIEANKPSRVFRSDSRIITWIGSQHPDVDFASFARACAENGIHFRARGGYTSAPVSDAENMRFIQESYMAPTLCEPRTQMGGYAPCRIFKNISYGQWGVTNSPFVNRIFGECLVYNQDVYRLFYDAKERLATVRVKELHDLMDDVAAHHTYLNRVADVEKAVRMWLDYRHD